MLNALMRLILAGLIAFGIVFYVTAGDLKQVTAALYKATSQASERKADRIAAKNSTPAEDAPEEETAISVVTKRSVAASMPSELRMTGSTEASRTVDVKTETTGMLASTTAKGTRVNEGDILCRLKVGDRGARREAAVARFRQAQVEEQAQARLSERGFAAANSASSARTSADVIRAEIKQLDIEIRRLEIRAPFSGVIEDDPAQVGAIMQMGSTCATIVDPDPLRVVGFAPEFRIGEVSIGTVGTAVLATGQTVQGTVVFIAQTADAATRTFRIDLSVPNPAYSLRDEVTAEITIPLGTQAAHTLPQSALTLNDDGKIGVMLVEDGKATFRSVEILRDSGDGVSLSGIGQTAEVIVVGQEYVSEGTMVETTSQADAELDGAT
jgi:multidrug efflux system membrane fusion protein